MAKKAITICVVGEDDVQSLENILTQQQIKYAVTYSFDFDGDLLVKTGGIFMIVGE